MPITDQHWADVGKNIILFLEIWILTVALSMLDHFMLV